jgi:hypothetical protein
MWSRVGLTILVILQECAKVWRKCEGFPVLVSALLRGKLLENCGVIAQKISLALRQRYWSIWCVVVTAIWERGMGCKFLEMNRKIERYTNINTALKVFTFRKKCKCKRTSDLFGAVRFHSNTPPLIRFSSILATFFSLRERDHLEDLSVDVRIILKWIFKKLDGWHGLDSSRVK